MQKLFELFTKHRVVSHVVLLAVSSFIFAAMGLSVGAIIGGNSTGLVFAGLPGYEGMGLLGSLIGLYIGLALAHFLVTRNPLSTVATLSVLWVVIPASLRYPELDQLAIAGLVVLGLVIVEVGGRRKVRLKPATRRLSWLVVVVTGAIGFGAAVYSFTYNYACLENQSLCLAAPPTVELSVKNQHDQVNKNYKFITNLSLYGDAYTLEQNCDNMHLVWNFEDGKTKQRSVCDYEQPNMFVSTRSTMKRSYKKAGEYPVSVDLLYNYEVIASSNGLTVSPAKNK